MLNGRGKCIDRSGFTLAGVLLDGWKDICMDLCVWYSIWFYEKSICLKTKCNSSQKNTGLGDQQPELWLTTRVMVNNHNHFSWFHLNICYQYHLEK